MQKLRGNVFLRREGKEFIVLRGVQYARGNVFSEGRGRGFMVLGGVK